VARNILWTWVLTMPIAAIFATLAYYLIDYLTKIL